MKLIDNNLAIDVSVEKGQTLSDVEEIYPLPTNGIFHKRIPGIGATHGEINAPRNSIIVLPNQPVIQSKVEKHNKTNPPEKEILGIYKGITIGTIQEYLSKKHVTHKKLLTTPEGYGSKVKEATAEIYEYVKKEYYLLIDECERTIQDVDYRSRITIPFDDFFDFTNKGLISATTLPFSDPRFEDFIHYQIVPKYYYHEPLTLVCTNNIVSAFRDYVDEWNCERYFIFTSSISLMTALIEAVDIKGESKIHCSENRYSSLRMQGFKADHILDIHDLEKFNFLTSRFYSAVDIELDYKPDVLMLTEVLFAEHSILDPQTEVIQIAGRFRKGFKSLTHITNFNPDITFKTPEKAREYVDSQQDVYKQILRLKETETMRNEGAQEAIKQVLTETKFSKFFKPDGSYNWFILDNYIQEERVMGLYKNRENLLQAYKHVEDHFELIAKSKNYPLTDADRLKRQSLQSRKEEIKEVVAQLVRLTPTLDNLILGGEGLRNEIIRDYPDVVEAFKTIGKDRIEQLDYSERRMKNAVAKFKQQGRFYKPEVIKAVHEKFKKGEFYEEMYIVTTLQDIFDRQGIKHQACAADIGKYFSTQRTTRKTGDHKGYKLLQAVHQDVEQAKNVSKK